MSETNEETWKVVPEFPNYAASTLGRVKRIKPGGGGARVGRILKPNLNTLGYPIVGLYKSHKRRMRTLHSVIVDTFKPGERTKGMQVNHIDGNKTNNRLENLEVVTRKENIRHAIENGLTHSRRGEPFKKLTDDDVRDIRRLFGQFSQRELAERYNVARSTIYSVLSGRSRKNVA